MQQGNGKPRKIGVTLVTGYLGAGKTTLINYILKNCGSKRIAVIENEFGEINIDKQLVAENIQSKELLITLDQGCVCCSLREDLVAALEKLIKKREEEGVEFDNVLLETTGLADPAPVAFTFFANRWVQKHFYLDAVVTVIDAKYTVMHLNEERAQNAVNEAVQQIAYADIIFLNKIDLIKSCPEGSSPSKQEDDETYLFKLNEVREQVRKINKVSKLLEVQLNSQDSELPSVQDLLEIKAFSMNRVLQVDPNFFESDGEEDESEHVQGQSATQGQGDDMPAPAAGVEECEVHRKGALAQKIAVERLGQACKSPCGSLCEACTRKAAQPQAQVQAQPQVQTSTQPQVQMQPQDYTQTQTQPKERDLKPKKRRKTLHDLSGVATVGISACGHLDKWRFDMFMKDLLTEKGIDIFRSKGIVAIKDHENVKFVFQGVHETFQYAAIKDEWTPDELPLNKLVLIGRNLDKEALKEGFRSCLWVPLPEGWTQHYHQSGRPYYFNSITGQKTWERQALFCPLAYVNLQSAQQPLALQPELRPASGSNTVGSSQTMYLKNLQPS